MIGRLMGAAVDASRTDSDAWPCHVSLAVARGAADAAQRRRAPPQVERPRADSRAAMSDITSQQLVVFSLGSEEYALPIGAVHEIIRYTEPRTVASESAWIRGVIGLRGKIIPIFDLAARMEIESLSSGPGKIVIVETGTGQVGVMVDEVEEVLTVTSDQLEHVPTARRESIEAIAKIEDRLVILLNAEGLFARAPAEDAAA